MCHLGHFGLCRDESCLPQSSERKNRSVNIYGLDSEVVDPAAVERTAQRFREQRISLPTFGQLTDRVPRRARSAGNWAASTAMLLARQPVAYPLVQQARRKPGRGP